MNAIKSKKIFSKILVSLAILTFLSPLTLQADFLSKEKKEEYNTNINTSISGTDISTEKSLEDIIGNIIRVILGAIGSIFLIMMVVAGNQWMRASGNQDTIKKAQGKITNLVIGTIIIFSAYILSYWISSILAEVLVN